MAASTLIQPIEVSQKIASTVTIKDIKGGLVAGTLLYGAVAKIWHKTSILFATGFIKIESLDRGSTIKKYLPVKLTYKDYSEANATATENITVEEVDILLDKYDIVTVKSDSADMNLLTKTGDIKGSIITNLADQKFKIMHCRFYDEIITVLKDKTQWEVTNASKPAWNIKAATTPTQSDEYNPSFNFDPTNDTTYPKSDSSGKIIYDLLEVAKGISNNIDQYATGIPIENLVCFVSPTTFLKMKFGLGRLGHSVEQIKERSDVIVIDGLTFAVDMILGKNLSAGLIHTNEGFDFSKIHAIFLVKNDTAIQSAETYMGMESLWVSKDPYTNNDISGSKFVSSKGKVATQLVRRFKVGTSEPFVYN